MEPFYIRQQGERMTTHERYAWFRACADEAKREGANLLRFTVHPRDGDLLLVEGWKGYAFEVGDQGEPRWSLQHTDGQRITG